MAHHLDHMAHRIFEAARVEHREGELLEALFAGGSATVDSGTGLLVIVTDDMLNEMMKGLE